MALSILNAISGGNETSSYEPLFIIEKDCLNNSPLPFYRTDSKESVSSECGIFEGEVRVGDFRVENVSRKIYSGVDEDDAIKEYDLEGGTAKKRKSLTETIWISVKKLVVGSQKKD